MADPTQATPTTLHAAATAGDVARIAELAAEGAALDAPGPDGWTALRLAASRGNAALVRRLLDAGADPAARSDDGRDAAAIAQERGHPDVAAMLRA